ncbi:4-alpha-glucanotransferase [Oceaniglobus roseus]|uniref:4-alpha-glucanotransferase n=1 Tax=Oceaniglobus roseus TaxID=1737570 RepID=UPI000C7F162C|nr:4-alpha-glucanotransferase [Kandeliimicrobium roseum]
MNDATGPRDSLGALADAAGIVPRFKDQTGKAHETGDATRAALLSAMGFDVSGEANVAEALRAIADRAAQRALPDWLVVEADAPGPEVPGAWSLTFETGETREGRGTLPSLPLGIHRLEVEDHPTWLLSAPPTLPAPPRTWGITLPIYGLRTATQGGVGSYGDLAEAMRGLGRAGAGFVGINPIHAGFPEDARAFSPYAPSSRRRFSTLHIETETDWPGGEELIDYADVSARQRHALRAMFEAAEQTDAFRGWRQREGQELERFALHQALSEVHGPYWTHWPEALRDPLSPEVHAFAEAHRDAVTFHAWLQWTAERQLGQVRQASDAMALGLYLDLAVGTHPEGAETWGDPDLFARGVSLGAPPDAFSKAGQRWNLAPMRPLHLERTGFRALAEILRAQLRFSRVLRIDHILGFERAFWVPEDPKVPGAYVTMPKAALLAVARIEAARVGAVIVGEDLGNIPDNLQRDLAASGILGCRVVMFEQDWDADAATFLPIESYSDRALTSFATHDLPTFLGWRAGRDIEWRRETGAIDEAGEAEAKRERQAEVAALDQIMGGGDVETLNRFLAAAPSPLVALQAEDLLGRIEQPNLPGTVYDHPNWRRRLGVGVAELAEDEGVRRAAETMKTAGR